MIPLCTWCGTDAFIEDYDADNDLAYCTGPGHAEPRMLQPKMEKAAKAAQGGGLAALGDGIAADLGLYEILPSLLMVGERAETGVVEYRYGEDNPKDYAWMLERWGHVVQAPRRYSTTSFIGSTLGQLSRATNVNYKPGPGTGCFAHNQIVGYWTLEPVPAQTVDLSWADFATERGWKTGAWPLL